MEYRFLGKTGLRVSQLAFGTMSFGGDADAAAAAELYRACREAGINFFDCANVYAQGESERLLGALVASERDAVVISSKAYFPTGDGPNDRGSSRYHLVRSVEASLRRLATDRIDVFFLHRFDDATDLEETLRGVELLVQQGKILYPGVSNFAAWQTQQALALAELRGWAPVVCCQPMYNLVKRQAEVEILPQARAAGLGVLSYSPLAGGLLSGKYGTTRQPDTGRLRENKMYQVRYGIDWYREVAEGFTALARELGLGPAALAIAWVAAHPTVTAPLIGARNLEQLRACLAATEVSLDADTRDRVSALSPAPPPATDRNEEASDHNFGQR